MPVPIRVASTATQLSSRMKGSSYLPDCPLVAQTFPATNLVGLARAPHWRGPYAFPLGRDGVVVQNYTEGPHVPQPRFRRPTSCL